MRTYHFISNASSSFVVSFFHSWAGLSPSSSPSFSSIFLHGSHKVLTGDSLLFSGPTSSTQVTGQDKAQLRLEENVNNGQIQTSSSPNPHPDPPLGSHRAFRRSENVRVAGRRKRVCG